MISTNDKLEKPLLKAMMACCFEGPQKQLDMFCPVYHDRANQALLACNAFQFACIKFNDKPFDPEAMDLAAASQDAIRLGIMSNRGKYVPTSQLFNEYRADTLFGTSLKPLLGIYLKQEYQPMSSQTAPVTITPRGMELATKLIKYVSPYEPVQLNLVERDNERNWVWYLNYYGTQLWVLSGVGKYGQK